MPFKSPNPRALGQALRQSRLNQGKSLREIAEDAEVSISYLSRLEQGEAINPSLSVMRNLERVLHIQLTTTEAVADVPPDATIRPGSAGKTELLQAIDECVQSLAIEYRQILLDHSVRYGVPDALGLAELLQKYLRQQGQQLISHSYQALEEQLRHLSPRLTAITPALVDVVSQSLATPTPQPNEALPTSSNLSEGSEIDRAASVEHGETLLHALSLGQTDSPSERSPQRQFSFPSDSRN